MDLEGYAGVLAAALTLFSAGGLLIFDSIRRAGVSEADFQRRNPLAACITRVLALWLGLVLLALGAGLVLLVVLTDDVVVLLRLLFTRH